MQPSPPGAPVPAPESLGRRVARWALAVLFVGAGVLHFVRPEVYVRIIPPGFPAPLALVLVSGVFEIVGGVGVLLGQPVRRWAGWGLALLLVAVFPSNVYMALEGIGADGPAGRALLWLRLPLQPVLIGWALWVGGFGLRAPSYGPRPSGSQPEARSPKP